MKKTVCLIVLSVFLLVLSSCGSLSKDEIMKNHLDQGPSISVDPSMFTFSMTLDASFGSIETKLEVNIISIYVYAYSGLESMDSETPYTQAYLIVEDKYALKNGASLAIDQSKYIIIYSTASSATTANEELLKNNAEKLLSQNRGPLGFGQIPFFDLIEILSTI